MSYDEGGTGPSRSGRVFHALRLWLGRALS